MFQAKQTKSLRSAADDDGWTPLHYAAEEGRYSKREPARRH